MNAVRTPHLIQWQQEGWLRPIDTGFADLLVTLAEESDEHVLIAAALTSFHLSSGHVCMDLHALLQAPANFLPKIVVPEEQPERGWYSLIATWQRMGLKSLLQRLQTSMAIGQGEGAEPLVLDGHRLYLRRYWTYETRVAAALRARFDTAENIEKPTTDLRTELTVLFGDLTADIDWQRVAVAMAARQRLTIISGGPGTGKTTTVVKLLSLLQGMALKERGRPLRIALSAPTGKAAARLTESIGGAVSKLPHAESIPTQVTTLHRLLGARPDSREFSHHRGNPLHVDILVIDEASMVDLEMMAAVVDALPAQTRLILLGDKDQLASVEAGAILGEICRDAHLARYSAATCLQLQASTGMVLASHPQARAIDDHIVTLKKSHRFSSQGGIGLLAQAMNAGDVRTTLSVLDSDDPSVRFELTSTLQATMARLVLDQTEGYANYLKSLQQERPPDLTMEQWAAQLLKQLSAFQVLCATRRGNAGVEALNQIIADILYKAGLIPQTNGWYAGRPVMVTRNDYALGLMNGDVGITLPDSGNSGTQDTGLLRVFFAQPQGIRRVLPSRLTQVETVFAMTVHKSQGSEFTHACLVLPEVPSPVLTRELVYTAVTRARERVTLAGAKREVLEMALRQQVFRCSGLAARLGKDA